MFFVANQTASRAATVVSALLFSMATASANTSVAQPSLPVIFEQNQGQAADGVKFVSRGASGVLLLSPNEMTLRVPGKATQFRLKLRGASNSTAVVGTGERSGDVNYLRGNQPAEWLTGIPSYTNVTYKSVYPKIDLVVYGNNRQFESDFVIAQGADPSVIGMQIDGKLAVKADGTLAIQAGGGFFELHRPFVYQLAENGARVAVDCHYTIADGNNVGFALGRYDRSKSLVIDPVLSYSTLLGGSGEDAILGIAGDLSGNIYVTGFTTSTDFKTANPVQAKEGGDKDCFVAKFDSSAQHLIYATYLGGVDEDRCTGVAVNLLGEAFVGGYTYSPNFPTKNPLQPSFIGTFPPPNSPSNTPVPVDGFVAHLDSTGSKLIFSTYLGGGGEFLTGIALDLLSNVYVTGVTNAPTFPVTKGAYQTTCHGLCYDNAFLSKISPDGSHLVYSTFLGGSNYDSSNGIAVDFTGSAYITGEGHSLDFPTTKSAYQQKVKGISNAFVSKFSPDGSSLVYSTFVGGTNADSARGIAIDLFGNAYVTGTTNSINFPTLNAFQMQFKAIPNPMSFLTPTNMFAFKLNSGGSTLAYSTYIGGSGYDRPFHISVDISGNASIVGETTSLDLAVKSAIQPAYAGGNLDAVVVNIATNGSLNYLTYLGSSGDDYGYAGYTDLTGATWVGGATYTSTTTNFPLTKNAYQTTLSGIGNAFLSKITP